MLVSIETAKFNFMFTINLVVDADEKKVVRVLLLKGN